MPRGPGCFLGIGVGPVGFEFHAASLSSLSAPRMTILSASFGSGRCNAFFVPWRAHPDVAFLSRRQDHGHRLRMDRLDDRVWRGRQEPVDEMRPGDRLRFGATTALELGPDAGEGEKRPILIQREPNDVLGPVYLRQQTFAAARWMSVLCQ